MESYHVTLTPYRHLFTSGGVGGFWCKARVGKECGMRTIIQTKDIKLPAFLQRWLDRSVSKLGDHHRHLQGLTARISREGKYLFRVQLFAKTKGQDHVIEVRESQLNIALSEAVDRMQRQLRRSKERTADLIKKRKRALRTLDYTFQTS